jgi:hypothetical protein
MAFPSALQQNLPGAGRSLQVSDRIVFQNFPQLRAIVDGFTRNQTNATPTEQGKKNL